SGIPVDNSLGQSDELLAGVPVQAGPRTPSIVERYLPGPLQGPGGGHAHECAVERSAGERAPDDLVLLRGEEQRPRGSALAEVGSGDLARVGGVACTVEDVVGDLEGDAERDPELAQLGPLGPTAEQASGLEELPGLQAAALEVGLDARIGVMGLAVL